MRISSQGIPVIALIIGLGAAGSAIGAGSGGQADGVQCAITAPTQQGMTSLEAIVSSQAPVDGSYLFRVKGGSSSSIQQGGAFNIGAEGSRTVGRVMLGGQSRTYDATLEVQVSGKAVRCSETIRAL